MSRAHNVVKWIRRSDPMSQLFKEGGKENQEIDQDHHLWTTYEKWLSKMERCGGIARTTCIDMPGSYVGISITSNESMFQIETKQSAFIQA